MKSSTQKLMIERLISSSEVFARCIPIISSEYFDPELRPIVKFILKYHDQYSTVPSVDYINTEYDCDLQPKKLNDADVKFTCDNIESFCKQSALYKAIVDSAPDVTGGNTENFGKVLDRVQKALAVSIQKDLGIDMYRNVEQRLLSYTHTDIYEPTGINGLDEPLGGGLARRQVTMFSANSGGGKSIVMANIAANYSRRGYNVLQLALELTDQMLDLRNISILSGVATDSWKQHIPDIVGIMDSHKQAGAGSFVLKRIPNGSSCNDIRAYLKLYESERGHLPDVLIVDYLDLLSPNAKGYPGDGDFAVDKRKSEELAALAYDYNCVCITASQQNRDGVRSTTPDQAIIAGGISKINTVDNYISVYMNPEMRLKGQMFLYFLKTRSSKAVGSMSQVCFNPDNLIVSDNKTTTISILNAIKNRKNNSDAIIFPGIGGVDIDIPSEFCDSIVSYHDNFDKNENDKETSELPTPAQIANLHSDTTCIDIEDDNKLWKKKDKFRLNQEAATEDLLDLMSSFN